MDFGVNYRRYKVLTREQELELFRDYHANNEASKAAFEALVNHNLGLVAKVVGKFKGRRNAAIEDEDYFSEGVVGLMIAIRKFDPAKGCKLSTFAMPWIFQTVSRAETTKAPAIRLPQHAAEIRMRAVRDSNFDAKAIAKAEGCHITTAEAILRTGFEPLELDKPICHANRAMNDDTFLRDKIDEEANFDGLQQTHDDPDAATDLARLLKLLPDTSANRRAIEVLKYRYGFVTGKTETLEATSKIFNCTRERIRQICERTLRVLRSKAAIENRRLAKIKELGRH